ncbi:hypothetical protein J3R03_008151 [Actinoplanes couchii]|nr:hypothetical protein [Actinoplanes couchii]
MIHALAERITKRFGDAIAVEAVDLEVRAGEVVGLLGPHGAGKRSAHRQSPAVRGPGRVMRRRPPRSTVPAHAGGGTAGDGSARLAARRRGR